ncbi:MAG: lipopolysaccharide kinase InaA family protein [Planctomyces sp.]
MNNPFADSSAVAEWWFFESSPAGQDEYLLSPSLHSELRGLWLHCPDRPQGLAEDSLPGIQLLDVLTTTRTSHVLRGITNDGIAVCVKLPRLDAVRESRQLELVNDSIRQEIVALRQLVRQSDLLSAIPSYVGDGVFKAADGIELLFVATRYVPNLTPLHRWEAGRGTDEVLGMLQRICGAVQKLHVAGWVHGDLHVGNVLVDGSSSQPFLVDLGCARRWRGLRWLRSQLPRYFGPPIPVSVHETQHPSAGLTPAFDVLCLALLAGDLLKRRLASGTAYSGPLLQVSPQPGSAAQSARLDQLLRACTWYEPGLRPQSAVELGTALRSLAVGPLTLPQRGFRTIVMAKMRRYGVFTISAVWLFLVVVLAAGGWFHVTLREREQYRQLQQLQTQLVAQLTSIPDNPAEDSRQASSRLQTLAQLLNLLTSQQRPDEQIRGTLEQILYLSRAILDLDGTLPLLEPLGEAVGHARLLAGRSAGDAESQLLLTELLATEAYCQYDRSVHGKPETDLPAAQLAQEALDTFFRIPPNVPRESRARAWRTAFFLADHTLYSQLSADWIRQRRDCPFRQVWEQAERLSSVVFTSKSAAADPDAVYWRAALLTIRALGRHKTGYRPEYSGDSNRAVVLQSLKQADTQIERLLQEPPSLLTIPLPIMRALRGRILSIWGMVLKSGVVPDYDEALEKLTATLNIRQQLFDSAPESLQRRRGLTATVQNLADCYSTLSDLAGSRSEREALRRKECEVRRRAIGLAADFLRQTGGRQWQEAYGVNIVRLIAAELDLGHDAEVERLLEEMLQLVDIPGPPYGDGFADPLIPALAARWQRIRGAEAEDLLHRQIEDLMRQLTSQRVIREQLRTVAQRLMAFLNAPHRSGLLATLRTRADWQKLELLLREAEQPGRVDRRP